MFRIKYYISSNSYCMFLMIDRDFSISTVMIRKNDRISKTIIIRRYRNIILDFGILLQKVNAVRVIEACTEVGIIDLLESQMLLFLTGEGVAIIRCRHVGLRPLLAEGIVILAIKVFAARRRHLRDHARAAQMIRQEIVYLRTVVRTDDPAAAERRTLELRVIVYQRTCVMRGLVVVVSAHLDLRAVGKIGIVQTHISFGVNYRRQVKKSICNFKTMLQGLSNF